MYRALHVWSSPSKGDFDLSVEIDFADSQVWFDAEGGYLLDDVDDYDPLIWETDDEVYEIGLSGYGDGDDIDFDNGVTYTGDLEGWVEVPVVGSVCCEEPVSMVGVVFGAEDVDDCGD